jgi:KDO2-lipid IV(A) lauroyltransferase
MIARNLGVPLAVSCLVREADARFRMKFEEIAVPATDDREADIAEATARIQAALERYVRAHPEQWMWAHRRWG